MQGRLLEMGGLAEERLRALQDYLWQGGFGPDAPDGIHVARPLGYIAEMRMFLQAHAVGDTLNELAGRGYAVAISDIGEAALQATVQELRDRGVRFHAEVVDVADRDAVHRHAAAVVEAFGRVDMVINNAGVAMSAWGNEQRHEDLRWLMEIDFFGVVHGTEAFFPHLVASGKGYLANVSSVFGFVGVAKQSAYNAAKFAVRRAELDVSRNELVSAIDARKNDLALEEAKRKLAELEENVKARAITAKASVAVLEQKRKGTN